MGKIAWLGDHGLTLNPGIYGCSPVGAGCDHCYAARMARRLVAMGCYPDGVVTPDGRWTGEVLYDYAADMEARIRKMPRLRSGERRRVFVTSMGDFPDSYMLTGTKAEQVGRIGNSVPPDLVEAVVRAQFEPELSRRAA